LALPSARRSLGFARKTASARNSSSKLGSAFGSSLFGLRPKNGFGSE